MHAQRMDQQFVSSMEFLLEANRQGTASGQKPPSVQLIYQCALSHCVRATCSLSLPQHPFAVSY